MMKIIKLDEITKKYGNNVVLSKINLSIYENEFVCITGESGAGKTTLLNIIGLIESFNSGKVTINGNSKFSKKDILNLRRIFFGYVFQDYLLMPEKTVENNIRISLNGDKIPNLEVETAIKEAGLNKDYLSKEVYKLSGGEKQKVAIARVLLKPYQVLLADEPTGNLDIRSRNEIIEIFKRMQRNGKTIVCVTHDAEVANMADRIILLSNPKRGEICEREK